VVRLSPHLRHAFREVRPFYYPAFRGKSQAEKGHEALEGTAQVVPKGGISFELSNILIGQQGGIVVESARLRQGEEPLNEIMAAFEGVIVPEPDVFQEAPSAIGHLTPIVIHKV
jgi:hypothetical protein